MSPIPFAVVAEAFRLVKTRFFTLFAILYLSQILLGAIKQTFIFNLHSLQYRDFGLLFFRLLFQEIIYQPLFWVLLLATAYISCASYAGLYAALGGAGFRRALLDGFKKAPRYCVFIIIAGFITIASFAIPLIPGLLLAVFSIPSLFQTTSQIIFSLPLIIILCLPGIFIMVSFAFAPFILLLENKGIMSSLKQSFRMIGPQWPRIALVLGGSGLVLFALFWGISWLIFSAKLLLPDFPGYIESLYPIFIFSLPWILLSVFFDAILYRLYQKYRDMGAIDRLATPPNA